MNCFHIKQRHQFALAWNDIHTNENEKGLHYIYIYIYLKGNGVWEVVEHHHIYIYIYALHTKQNHMYLIPAKIKQYIDKSKAFPLYAIHTNQEILGKMATFKYMVDGHFYYIYMQDTWKPRFPFD